MSQCIMYNYICNVITYISNRLKLDLVICFFYKLDFERNLEKKNGEKRDLLQNIKQTALSLHVSLNWFWTLSSCFKYIIPRQRT